MVEIEYGLSLIDKEFVHISSISSGKTELVCPSCYELGKECLLIAAKGEQKEHHFKHFSGNHEKCGGGEGVLHLFVKNLLCKEKNIIINNIHYKFKDCIEEYNFNNKKIDVCGILENGTKIFLEVVVTHSMYDDKEGLEKINLIRKSGILCYELFIKPDISKDDIYIGLFENSNIIPKLSIYQNTHEDFNIFYSNFFDKIKLENQELSKEYKYYKTELSLTQKQIDYLENEINYLSSCKDSYEKELQDLRNKIDEKKNEFKNFTSTPEYLLIQEKINKLKIEMEEIKQKELYKIEQIYNPKIKGIKETYKIWYNKLENVKWFYGDLNRHPQQTNERTKEKLDKALSIIYEEFKN